MNPDIFSRPLAEERRRQLRAARRERHTYAIIGIVLWFAAVWLTYTVSHRLALAAVLGSVAFNLSEWIRDQARS